MGLPRIDRIGHQPRLIVDGRPFLILGLQWDCDACFSPEEMNPLFPQAARLGANTVTLPTYWREIEPTPGHYDFRMIDERIRQARAHNLRVIPLWFATWKNASVAYCPDDVRDDQVTYRRAVNSRGQPLVSLCPTSEATWKRDRDALVALITHLQTHDAAQTVIMIQIENEPGILGSDRCYCPDCNTRFVADGWASTWGEHAAEAFSAASIATYIERLSVACKAIYPIPTYINVWLAPRVGGIPGRDYPSGGAVATVLSLFREYLRTVDLVAPDIYASGFRDFRRTCEIFASGGNPLYVAEHSSSLTGRAERNAFYAIGEHGAIGFDPWAIDHPYPERFDPPLVDPIGGEWGPQAYALRDSYVSLSRAIEPIVEAQGSERICTCVQEPGESGAGWAAEGSDLLITYTDRDRAGRGIIIQQAPNEFLLIGVGFNARFREPRPDGRPIPIARAEWGRFQGGEWRCLHPMRRERSEDEGQPIGLREPGVARVWLDR